jgi:hypothetical protein
MLYPSFLNYSFRACPISPQPLIPKPSGTTAKIHYPPYHIPHQKYMVSYFTSRTLISEPPTFSTRGWGTRVLRQGVPAFYDEHDDDVDVDVDDDDDDDGAITTK